MRVYLGLFLLALSFAHANSHADTFNKAIYGDDNRVEISTLKAGDRWNDLGRATAAMIPRNRFLYDSTTKLYTLKIDKTLESYGICATERFAKQPMAANCTGFLVEKDLIITAGHCVANADACKNFRWVFDYKMKSDSEVTTVYSKREVHQCKSIERQAAITIDSIDYALVRLYTKVEGRTPMELDKNIPKKGTPLVIIGHPTGLPSKIAPGAVVKKINSHSFEADLDSFAGNSGSPVFNATSGKVLGILVSGSPDYVYDEELKCTKANICTDTTCRNEVVSLINNAIQ